MTSNSKKSGVSRREFNKLSAAAVGSLAATSFTGIARASEPEIRVGLVGCGGRGIGAAVQALNARANTRLVAVGDVFRRRLDRGFARLTDPEREAAKTGLLDRVDVPEERKFSGFDNYQKVIDACDVVILATPPAFRPQHFEAAIAANKHVFMEKPVATDAPGVRRVLATAEEAKRKELNVVVGLQRRYHELYTGWIEKIQDGAIGDIILSRAYWNSGGVQNGWLTREDSVSELQYQLANWYWYTWSCGDHNVEQHIHNIDVCNWAKQGYPVRAQGQGGREVRTDPRYGQIYDHHFVEYEYDDGSRMLSQCRHMPGTQSSVTEAFHGTKGSAPRPGVLLDAKGEYIHRHREPEDRRSEYQIEHDVLFDAIAKGEYRFADAENGALATLTAIMGRMATYSGQVIEWDAALNSETSLVSDFASWDDEAPVQPDADGNYPVAVPGVTAPV